MEVGFRRLADEPWPVSLAISLHAADDELRSSLVPINRRYPIAMLEGAAAEYFEKKGRRVSIEWTMMDGVNDTSDQAAKQAPIARRLRPCSPVALNPTPLSVAGLIPIHHRDLRQSPEARGVNVTTEAPEAATSMPPAASIGLFLENRLKSG